MTKEELQAFLSGKDEEFPALLEQKKRELKNHQAALKI